jgi:hypothetical protein
MPPFVKLPSNYNRICLEILYNFLVLTFCHLEYSIWINLHFLSKISFLSENATKIFP